MSSNVFHVASKSLNALRRIEAGMREQVLPLAERLGRLERQDILHVVLII